MLTVINRCAKYSHLAYKTYRISYKWNVTAHTHTALLPKQLDTRVSRANRLRVLGLLNRLNKIKAAGKGPRNAHDKDTKRVPGSWLQQNL